MNKDSLIQFLLKEVEDGVDSKELWDKIKLEGYSKEDFIQLANIIVMLDLIPLEIQQKMFGGTIDITWSSNSEEFSLELNDTEILKSVGGFPYYYVSNKGNIYVKRYESMQPKLINPTEYKNLLSVSLYREGRIYRRSVAKLVMRAFAKEFPVDKNVRHKDGNYKNNNFNNLY
jgi:hypothetical protein